MPALRGYRVCADVRVNIPDHHKITINTENGPQQVWIRAVLIHMAKEDGEWTVTEVAASAATLADEKHLETGVDERTTSWYKVTDIQQDDWMRGIVEKAVKQVVKDSLGK